MYGKEYYDAMNKKAARKERWEKMKFPLYVVIAVIVVAGVAMYVDVIPNPFKKPVTENPAIIIPTDEQKYPVIEGEVPEAEDPIPEEIPEVNPEAPNANIGSGGQPMEVREDGSMEVTPDERDLPNGGNKVTTPPDASAQEDEWTWTTNERGQRMRSFDSVEDLKGLKPIEPYEDVMVDGIEWGWDGFAWFSLENVEPAGVEEIYTGGLSGHLIGH